MTASPPAPAVAATHRDFLAIPDLSRPELLALFGLAERMRADLRTDRQHLGGWEGKKVAWIGDGNNMANSWINAAYRLGFELALACPEGYEPADHLLDRARTAANVTLTRDPREAVAGAHVVN